MHAYRDKAFTLVELLVVIAIISLLAGLLLPVLEEAVESARTIVCENNLKQVTMACHGYAEDNNGWLYIFNSRHHYGNDLYPYQSIYFKLIDGNYIETDSDGNSQVLYCPIRIANQHGTRIPYGYRHFKIYYKIFTDKIIAQVPASTAPPYPLDPPVTYPYTPSQFVLWADANSDIQGSSVFYPGGGGKVFNLRHNDRGTAAFADGHVLCLGPEDLPEYGITDWWVGTDGFYTE